MHALMQTLCARTQACMGAYTHASICVLSDCLHVCVSVQLSLHVFMLVHVFVLFAHAHENLWSR